MSEENRRNEEAEWAEWEETMQGTTPEHRAEVFEICERLQKNAQEGLDALERVPSGYMSAADRMAKSNRLQHAIEIAHARMEFLKPYIEADQARQAEEEALQEEVGSDLEGEYNGFDWTEVEEAVERESAELESTQVYKNRVSASRQAWSTMEERRSSPVTPTGAGIHGAETASSAPQPEAGNEAAPQPAPRAMAKNGVEARPVAGVSDSRARYPENRSSVRVERETPQTATPISSTHSNTSRSKIPSEAPNFWQRYMPEELGGWSKEKVAAWDNAHPKAAEQGKPQTEAATLKGGDGREVFRGVTVSELREAGYSSEQIQRMDMMVDRARPRSGGLIETLGAASRANITREDYQAAGFNNQDMATIYKLSQNDR